MTSTATRSLSLGDAWRQFWTNPSPFIIATFLSIAVVARIVVGDVQRTDLLLLLGLLAIQPLVEWAVHIVVLHWRPRKVAGRTVDFLLARKHREHHADPRDPELVYIPWQVFLWLLPAELAIATLAFDRAGLAVTYLVTVGMIGMVYEWTHYLVHTDYRPKGRIYRGIWRHHRLHHFKNERYWFSISRTWPDRLLGTDPDPRDVESSPTVRNLHADSITG